MSNKLKVTLLMIVTIVAVVTFYIFLNRPTEGSTQAKEEAIKQAQEYKLSEEVCQDVISPATHKATGAKYEFSSPCAVPPGWTIDK